MKILKGQIALVTGASRGIGAAILRVLGEEGATVVGTATSESGATAIQELIDVAGWQGAGHRVAGD